jgi:hypothetical protein
MNKSALGARPTDRISPRILLWCLRMAALSILQWLLTHGGDDPTFTTSKRTVVVSVWVYASFAEELFVRGFLPNMNLIASTALQLKDDPAISFVPFQCDRAAVLHNPIRVRSASRPPSPTKSLTVNRAVEQDRWEQGLLPRALAALNFLTT